MTYVLVAPVFSAFDSLPAGTRVEVQIGTVGLRDYVDVHTARCTVRKVLATKLARAQ